MSYECLDEGGTFITHLLVPMHQEAKVAPEIAAKIVQVSSTNLFKELDISIYLNRCDTVTYCLMVGNEDSIQQKANVFLK